MLTLWLFAAVYYDQARIQGAIDKTTKKIDCSKISSSCGITVELCAGLRDKPGNLHAFTYPLLIVAAWFWLLFIIRILIIGYGYVKFPKHVS